MSQIFKRVWRARSEATTARTTWGIIGLCGVSFAYTYPIERAVFNDNGTPRRQYGSDSEAAAALRRYLWVRDNLYNSRRNLDAGRWWTPLTSTFCHGSVAHLAFNMTSLYSFAPVIIQTVGFGPFMALYIAGGWLSSLLASTDKAAYNTPSLGASGAVCAIMSFNAAMYPRMPLLFMGVVQMPSWAYCLAFGGVSVWAQATNSIQGLGHLAHLGGLAIGPAYYVLRILLARKRF